MFKILKEYLNNNFELYIREWFPNAIKVSSTICKTGDFNDSKPKNKNSGSLVFNLRDKYAKDFSTGESAGDIIAIYAKRFCSGDNKKAFDELIKRYNLEYLFSNRKSNYHYHNDENYHNDKNNSYNNYK